MSGPPPDNGGVAAPLRPVAVTSVLCSIMVYSSLPCNRPGTGTDASRINRKLDRLHPRELRPHHIHGSLVSGPIDHRAVFPRLRPSRPLRPLQTEAPWAVAAGGGEEQPVRAGQ